MTDKNLTVGQTIYKDTHTHWYTHHSPLSGTIWVGIKFFRSWGWFFTHLTQAYSSLSENTGIYKINEWSNGKCVIKCYISVFLTFGTLPLAGFVAVHAHHKATFVTGPMYIKQSGLTCITHLSHTSHRSLPHHLGYTHTHTHKKRKREDWAIICSCNLIINWICCTVCLLYNTRYICSYTHRHTHFLSWPMWQQCFLS